jgi:hypothetical protein
MYHAFADPITEESHRATPVPEVRRALGERVSDSHPLELPKVAIMAPDCADAVLPHQRDEMGVGDEVSADNRAGADPDVRVPKIDALA